MTHPISTTSSLGGSAPDAVAIVARGEQEAERLCYDLRQYCK